MTLIVDGVEIDSYNCATSCLKKSFVNISNLKLKFFKFQISVKPCFQAHVLISEYHFISRSYGHEFMPLFLLFSKSRTLSYRQY